MPSGVMHQAYYTLLQTASVWTARHCLPENKLLFHTELSKIQKIGLLLERKMLCHLRRSWELWIPLSHKEHLVFTIYSTCNSPRVIRAIKISDRLAGGSWSCLLFLCISRFRAHILRLLAVVWTLSAMSSQWTSPSRELFTQLCPRWPAITRLFEQYKIQPKGGRDTTTWTALSMRAIWTIELSFSAVVSVFAWPTVFAA